MNYRISIEAILLLTTLSGCTSLVGDTRSVPEVIADSQARGAPEARFQRYGPFTFLGKYRIQHEWLQAHPALGGQGGCSYAWAGTTKDEYGHFVPTRAGLDMWEANDVLYQKDFSSRTGLPQDRNMTIYVIGKYRPNAPGGPRYGDHEAMCSTAFDGIGNLFNVYLKKATLADLRDWDERRMLEWRYAKLLEPLRYETTLVNGIPAEKLTQVVALGLKGSEDKPVRRVTEEIRVPIGDTGYVYQLAFTLSDTIVQNEPEKAARRRAYWQRIQDSFRIEALQR